MRYNDAIYLDDYVNLDALHIIDITPFLNVLPDYTFIGGTGGGEHDGGLSEAQKEAFANEIVANLSRASHMQVWRKEEIPTRFHIKDTRVCAVFLLLCLTPSLSPH